MGRGTPKALRRAQQTYQERNRKKLNEKRRERYRKNREAELELLAKKRNTEKGKASAKLRYAVYSGKVIKPNTCEMCLTVFEDKGKIHGHHTDYSRPLEVQWLCSICHGKSHRLD